MQSGGRASNFQKFRQNDDAAGCFVLTCKTAADIFPTCEARTPDAKHQPRKVETMSNATTITAKQQAALEQFFNCVRLRFVASSDDQYSENIVDFNFIHSYVCASAVVIFASGRSVYVEAKVGTRGSIRKVQTTHRNLAMETMRVVKGVAWR